MELLAVIVALETIKGQGKEVRVTTDSRYVVDAVEKGWVWSWEKKNFKQKANPDLWKRFLQIYPRHKVSFQWIRGNNGHAENELCDQLAVEAAKGDELLVDFGYETLTSTGQ
jgi:ribonuclease HI